MTRQAGYIASLLLLSSLQAFSQGRPASLRSQNTNVERPAAESAATPPAPAPAHTAAMPTPAPGSTGAPRVLLGTIETTESSREKVLAYPRLIPTQLGCDVKGFSFTMATNGTVWGPETVKGAVLTEEIKDKIKEAESGKVKISIDNIRLNCGGSESIAPPISIDYGH